jgi:hypothetical protein
MGHWPDGADTVPAAGHAAGDGRRGHHLDLGAERFIIGPGNAAAAVASIVIWNLATNANNLNAYFALVD